MFDIDDALILTLAENYSGDRPRQQYFDAFGTYDAMPVIDEVRFAQGSDGDFATGTFSCGRGRSWFLEGSQLIEANIINTPLSISLANRLLIQFYRKEREVLVREIYGGSIAVVKVLEIEFKDSRVSIRSSRSLGARNRVLGRKCELWGD